MSGFSGGFAGSRRPDAPRGPPLPMHLMNMCALQSACMLLRSSQMNFAAWITLVRFTPRPPVEYLKPIHKKVMGPYTGVAKFVARSSLIVFTLISRAALSYVNLDNFESREVWLQSRVKHRVPETRDQRYERVKKEREARGKQVGRLLMMLFSKLCSSAFVIFASPFATARRGARKIF